MRFFGEKIYLFFLICFICLTATDAQEKRNEAAQIEISKNAVTVNLWPEGKIPGSIADNSESDLPAKGDNVRRITNISNPTLTVFPARNKNAPAVIICPGGGYNYVVFDKEGTEVAAWLNSNGFTALVLKYRAPKNRDGAFQDVQRALRFARTRAKEWNIDPTRLGILGFSAGGHLATKASNLFETQSYQPIDAIDKQNSRPDFAVLVYPAYLERNGQIAPELNLKTKIPPTLIVHTEDDKTFIAGSKIYRAALIEAKVRNEFLLYATGGHGYGLRSDKEARAWPEATLDWLRKIKILKRR